MGYSSATEIVSARGRYFAVFVDVLLDQPRYIPLEKSPTSIGIGQEWDWQLPLQEMASEFVLDGLEPECRDALKLKLFYSEEDGAWFFPPFSRCPCAATLRHPFLEMQVCKGSSVDFVAVESLHFFTRKEEYFRVNFREPSAVRPRNIASFTFIFLDLQKLSEQQAPSSLILSSQPAQSLPAADSLLSLTDVALASVVRHINPTKSVEILPLISSQFLHTRIRGLVPWRVIRFQRGDPLDSIRIFSLVCSSSIRQLHIAEQLNLYNPRQRKFGMMLYNMYPALELTEIRLLHVDDVEILLRAGVPRNLEHINLDGWHWSSAANWDKIWAQVFPPSVHTATLEFADNNGRDVRGFFSKFPNVRTLSVDFCPGPNFWGALEPELVYEPLKLTRLSALITHWSVIPWRRLRHLTFMDLDFGDLEQGELDVVRRIFSDCGPGCSLPNLETFSMRCFGSGDTQAIDSFFASLSAAAPKLTALKFSDSTFFEVRGDVLEPVVRHFPHLRCLLGYFCTVKSSASLVDLFVEAITSDMAFAEVDLFGPAIRGLAPEHEVSLSARGHRCTWTTNARKVLFENYQGLCLKLSRLSSSDEEKCKKLFQL